MTDFTFISSADNEKIKLYKRLSADKKLRRKEQLFTVEGARLTADAAAEAIELHCVFFTENALKKYSEALELLFSKYNKKTFSMISDELAASLSDTQMSQGIFPKCRMPKPENEAPVSIQHLTLRTKRIVKIPGVPVPLKKKKKKKYRRHTKNYSKQYNASQIAHSN